MSRLIFSYFPQTGDNCPEQLIDNLRKVGHKVFPHIGKSGHAQVYEDLTNIALDADTLVLYIPSLRATSYWLEGFMDGLDKRIIEYNPNKDDSVTSCYIQVCSEEELLSVVAEPIPGVCRVCGCTEHNPCYNHDGGGYCWWADEEQTLCSHCANLADEGEYSIKDDPNTVHCVNDKSEVFKKICSL